MSAIVLGAQIPRLQAVQLGRLLNALAVYGLVKQSQGTVQLQLLLHAQLARTGPARVQRLVQRVLRARVLSQLLVLPLQIPFAHRLLLHAQLARTGPARVQRLVQRVLRARVQTALSLLLVPLPLILFVAHQLVQRLALSVNLYLDLPVLGVQQERIKAHPPLPVRHAQRALLAPLV